MCVPTCPATTTIALCNVSRFQDIVDKGLLDEKDVIVLKFQHVVEGLRCDEADYLW